MRVVCHGREAFVGGPVVFRRTPGVSFEPLLWKAADVVVTASDCVVTPLGNGPDQAVIVPLDEAMAPGGR